MSIVKFPQNIVCPKEIVCALCGRRVELELVTVGPVNANGAMTLLCSGHLWDGLKFINQLADYTAAERDKYFKNNIGDIVRFGGGQQVAGLVY